MADILHDLPIKAPIDRVFDAVSTPEGLDAWWTDRSSGTPGMGEEYVLWFGPEYDWRARVSRIAPPTDFELEMTRADDDWTGTHVGFRLQPRDGATWLQSLMPAGRVRTSTIACHPTAGRCTCGSCGDSSSMAKPFCTMCDWTRRMQATLGGTTCASTNREGGRQHCGGW